MTSTASLTIRPAGPADEQIVARLSALDSQRAPNGDVLIAFRDDEPVAAIAIESGQVVADPFRPTVSVVELLRTTAARADALAARPQRVNGHVRELRVAA
jgi:hypothetical protein